MRKIILMIAVFVFTSNANALSDSGPAHLTGGTIKPGDYFVLQLIAIDRSQRTWDTTYRVTCDIENPNYDKRYPVVLTLPSVDQKTDGGQILLNQRITKYDVMVKPMIVADHLVFRNHDNTDSVYIKDCIETYATN